MGDRLRELRKILGLTQREFAEKIGVSQSALSLYESGRDIQFDPIIKQICRQFGISEVWLRTGEGEMYTSTPTDEILSSFFAEVLSDDKDFKYRFVAKLARLTPEQWDWIADFAEDLNEKDPDE